MKTKEDGVRIIITSWSSIKEPLELLQVLILIEIQPITCLTSSPDVCNRPTLLPLNQSASPMPLRRQLQRRFVSRAPSPSLFPFFCVLSFLFPVLFSPRLKLHRSTLAPGNGGLFGEKRTGWTGPCQNNAVDRLTGGRVAGS
jgi:hypothetical protein